MTKENKRISRRIPDTERKKNMIAVRLTDAELEALERISRKEGLPVAYFVRKAIAHFVAGQNK